MKSYSNIFFGPSCRGFDKAQCAMSDLPVSTQDGPIVSIDELSKKEIKRAKNREAKRRWRIKNPNNAKEINKKWRINHPDKVKENLRLWRLNNPEKYKDQQRRYVNKHGRIRYRRNREKLLEEARIYRKNNPDKVRQAKRKWSKLNPDKTRAHCLKRIATKHNAQGSNYTKQYHIKWRWEMWGGKCWICGKKAEATDHVISLNRGGSHWPANLRPICKFCNSSKCNNPHHKYIKQKQGVL